MVKFSKKYQNNSNIQKKQSNQLKWMIKKHITKLGISPSLILDLGCGIGELTKELVKDIAPNAKTIGIDESNQQIELAKKNLNEDYNIVFKKARIETFEYPKKFDLIFSSSTMHWIQEQEKAYKNIYQLLNKNGVLAVHQGYKNCYQELRDVAEDVIYELGFSKKFSDWKYPLEYHTKKSIKKLLEKVNFNILENFKIESEQTNTLINDFIHAGLLPYTKKLNDVEKRIFIDKFKKKTNKLTYINTNRLYFVANKIGVDK